MGGEDLGFFYEFCVDGQLAADRGKNLDVVFFAAEAGEGQAEEVFVAGARFASLHQGFEILFFEPK